MALILLAERVIARLVVLETRFWEYVKKDIEPPADGSASAAKALRQLYRGNDTRVDFTGDEVCRDPSRRAPVRAVAGFR